MAAAADLQHNYSLQNNTIATLIGFMTWATTVVAALPEVELLELLQPLTQR